MNTQALLAEYWNLVASNREIDAQVFYETHSKTDKRFGSIVKFHTALMAAFQEECENALKPEGAIAAAVRSELEEQIPEIARRVASRLVGAEK